MCGVWDHTPWVGYPAVPHQTKVKSLVQLGSQRVEYDPMHNTIIWFFIYAIVLIILTFRYPKLKFSEVVKKHINGKKKHTTWSKIPHNPLWYAYAYHIMHNAKCYIMWYTTNHGIICHTYVYMYISFTLSY